MQRQQQPAVMFNGDPTQFNNFRAMQQMNPNMVQQQRQQQQMGMNGNQQPFNAQQQQQFMQFQQNQYLQQQQQQGVQNVQSQGQMQQGQQQNFQNVQTQNQQGIPHLQQQTVSSASNTPTQQHFPLQQQHFMNHQQQQFLNQQQNIQQQAGFQNPQISQNMMQQRQQQTPQSLMHQSNGTQQVLQQQKQQLNMQNMVQGRGEALSQSQIQQQIQGHLQQQVTQQIQQQHTSQSQVPSHTPTPHSSTQQQFSQMQQNQMNHHRQQQQPTAIQQTPVPTQITPQSQPALQQQQISHVNKQVHKHHHTNNPLPSSSSSSNVLGVSTGTPASSISPSKPPSSGKSDLHMASTASLRSHSIAVSPTQKSSVANSGINGNRNGLPMANSRNFKSIKGNTPSIVKQPGVASVPSSFNSGASSGNTGSGVVSSSSASASPSVAATTATGANTTTTATDSNTITNAQGVPEPNRPYVQSQMFQSNLNSVINFRKQMANLATLKFLEFCDSIGNRTDQVKNILYWKNIITENFSESGVMRYSVKSGTDQRQFEFSVPIIPRFFFSIIQSGVARIEISPGGLKSQVLANGTTYLESSRCCFSHYYTDGSYVNIHGSIKASFNQSLKLDWIDFQTHVFVPGIDWQSLEMLISDETKFSQIMDTYNELHKDKMKKGDDSTDSSFGRTNSNIVKIFQSFRSNYNVFHNMSNFGLQESVMRVMQVSDVMAHLRNLMLFSMNSDSSGPLNALEKFVMKSQQLQFQQQQLQLQQHQQQMLQQQQQQATEGGAAALYPSYGNNGVTNLVQTNLQTKEGDFKADPSDKKKGTPSSSTSSSSTQIPTQQLSGSDSTSPRSNSNQMNGNKFESSQSNINKRRRKSSVIGADLSPKSSIVSPSMIEMDLMVDLDDKRIGNGSSKRVKK